MCIRDRVDVAGDHDRRHRERDQQDRRHVEQQVGHRDRGRKPGQLDGGIDEDDDQQSDDRHLAGEQDAAPQRAAEVRVGLDDLGVRGGAHAATSLVSRSLRDCRTARTRSRTMAPRIMAPTTAFCQQSGMPMTGSARLIVYSKNAPIAAPTTVPLPPTMATPPMTAAPIASSSKPNPAWELMVA